MTTATTTAGSLMVAVLMMVSGCLGASPERFYRLASGAEAAAGAGPTVVVMPAAVPALVDRPQLVLQSDAQQVVVLEQQRWAEPLRAGIPRVVAENLGALLGSAAVSTRDEALGPPDCRVSLDVRRFDAAPGGVTVDALWTVACRDAAPRTGRSVARERTTDARPDTAVGAHGRALARISRDIAAAVRDATSELRQG